MVRIAPLALSSLLAVPLSACAFGHSEDIPEVPEDPGDDSRPPYGGGGSGGCAEEISLEFDIVALAPDVLLVLDRSSSMGEPVQQGSFTRKWDVVIEAIDDVTTQLADRIYLGLMLVPSMGETCGPGIIDIAPAIDSTKNFSAYLDEVWPGGGSPLASSLDNARAYFGSVTPNPNGRYVLFATDGAPNCDSTGEADEKAIQAIQRLRSAGIPTYVLGYEAGADAAVLDQMAAAGGTGAHLPASSSYELVQALEQVTSEVTEVSCEYQLSEGPQLATDLIVSVGGQEIPHSPDHTDGWDYDPDTRILTFYGPACDALRTAGDAEIRANYCNVVD